MADDFIVLDKTPSTLMMRGGSSPRTCPDGPREIDTIVELSARPDARSRTVQFVMKSIVLDGTSTGSTVPMNPVGSYLHTLYARLLVSVGVNYCML